MLGQDVPSLGVLVGECEEDSSDAGDTRPRESAAVGTRGGEKGKGWTNNNALPPTRKKKV